MMLYSHIEICELCLSACIHQCCGNFCHCKDNHEEELDFKRGTCEYRRERGENEKKKS